MSGIEQRTAAINGDHNSLKEYIIARCNVCSADEFGLTPLHYAVWNGHLECIRLLICNTLGVDAKGDRNQSIKISSCLGYTALHLAALDCPIRVVYDVAILLFLSGIDINEKCAEGKTALIIAEERNNEGFLKAYQEYIHCSENEEVMNRYEALQELLNKKYCHQVNTKTRGQVVPFEAKFVLPDFLFDDSKRTGNIPKELNIHEYQIRPLIQTGFNEMKRLQSLACLNFTKQETLANKARREHLIECSKDESFTRVDISYENLVEKK